jgi:hypothetical protein
MDGIGFAGPKGGASREVKQTLSGFFCFSGGGIAQTSLALLRLKNKNPTFVGFASTSLRTGRDRYLSFHLFLLLPVYPLFVKTFREQDVKDG